ncbi:MAG: DUF2723 domain-containing protein [Kiritimatiellia bacterium]
MKLSVPYKNRLCAGGVFLLFFVLYALTAQHGVSWQDSGEFQYRLLAGDYFWNSGIARAHPLYILLGRGFISIFPYSLKLYGCSLFSGFCMSLALAVLFSVVARVTSSLGAAFVAVLTLGFSHMCWWMSTVAEVYSLSLLFVMTELFLLYMYSEKKAVRYLIFLFAVNGAHFSVHNAALLALPVYGILLILHAFKSGKRGVCSFLFATSVWVLAGSMIWWQVGCCLQDGAGLGDVCGSVLFGKGYMSHVTGFENFNSSLFLSNMALAAVSFVSLCWVFVPIGLFQFRKQGDALFLKALIALTAVHFLFWIRYFVPDQATFILPLLGMLAVWCGVGFSAVRKKFCLARAVIISFVAAGLLINIAVLCLAPMVAQNFSERVKRNRITPGRSEMTYWLQPWKHTETSAQSFTESVSKLLGNGDILYADSTTAAPFMAAGETASHTLSFELLSPWTGVDRRSLEKAVTDGRFYVVSPVNGYVPEWLIDGRYTFEKTDVVYRVLKED